MTALHLATIYPLRAAACGLLLASSLVGLGWLIDPDHHKPTTRSTP